MTQKTKLPDYSPLFKPRWSGDVGGYTKEQLQAYGAACAAHAMQSQAERIKDLEVDFVRLEATAQKFCVRNAFVEAERDELRAQLAAIAAAEPAYYLGGGRLYADKTRALFDNSKNAITELFTRPMPAQDVTELVEALQWLKDAMTEGDQSDVNHAIAKCFEALSKYKGAKG